jgi:hypothetical protein
MTNETTAAAERVAKKMPTQINGETPLEFARTWYRADDIHRAIYPRSHGGFDDSFQKPPSDVTSMAFAEWLASQYQLAMCKGMDIAQRAIEPTYADLARELADLKAQAAAFADETPLTPEAVMEMLPGNVEDYGGSMGGDYSSAVGKIAWGWYLSEDPDVGHEFWLQVSSRNVALCELTIGRFRHLLTALAIAPEQK